MKSRITIWRQLAGAAVVAISAAIGWALLCGWTTSLVQTLFPGKPQIYESIYVAMDGTPVISSSIAGTYSGESISRRTLDNQPWPNDYESWLGGENLHRRRSPPGVVRLPVRWNDYGARVGALSDGKKPPTAWYVVRPDESLRQMYFAAYDPASKLAVGSIGTKGFRLGVPPLDEQFRLPDNEADWVSEQVAGSQYVDPGELARFYDLSAYQRPAPWLFYFVNGEHLWEIDVRQRTSRILMDVPNAISVTMLNVLQSTTEGATSQVPAAPAADGNDNAGNARPPRFQLTAFQGNTFIAATPTAALVAENPIAERPKMTGVVAIRTDDRVLLYDPITERKWEFKFPAENVNDSFVAYWIAPDTLLLNHYDGWTEGYVAQLYWISPDGAVKRHESVNLQGYRPPTEEEIYWGVLAAAPEPVTWLAVLFGVQPFDRLQNHKSDTYAEAVSHIIGVAWPMFTIVLMLSLIATLIVVRWQRRYYRSNTGLWAAFTFLAGVPGLAAYWIEHRYAAMTNCEECKVEVPRDRDTCAACDAPFPTPSLVGTEIFA